MASETGGTGTETGTRTRTGTGTGAGTAGIGNQGWAPDRECYWHARHREREVEDSEKLEVIGESNIAVGVFPWDDTPSRSPET